MKYTQNKTKGQQRSEMSVVTIFKVIVVDVVVVDVDFVDEVVIGEAVRRWVGGFICI